jgi:hypothetical protein
MEHMFLHIQEIELVLDKTHIPNKIPILDKIVKIIHKIDKYKLININILLIIKIKMFHQQLVEKVQINLV